MTTTTLRIQENKLKFLKIIATINNKSVNRIVNELITEYLEDFEDSRDAQKALKEAGGFSLEELKSEWDL
ncbi:MAG: hypothetical protein KAU06_00370 [Candidatus Marinimicrobia bacterium]|nr:hypothetical protein [Candidatus Neomarinimicrobiota bacterium]